MSGASTSQNPDTSKATTDDSSATPSALQQQQQKQPAQLEEDDEFEDFPVEDWPTDTTTAHNEGNAHLWEESWDDDDTNDDFAVMLKEELRKVGEKRGDQTKR
ncbi:MAG: hypothetical protein Q9162_006708 [Coniocarpon cinnabarinum]